MAPGREQSAAREEGVDSFIHIIFLTLFMQHILHSSAETTARQLRWGHPPAQRFAATEPTAGMAREGQTFVSLDSAE